MRRAVFLDRDGVINRAIVRAGKPYPPASLAELEILPGVSEAIGAFKQAGLAVIVVTNQPDIAKGIQRREVVESFHEHLRTVLAIDEIRVCPHVDEDRCECRKPRPGMLLAAARERKLNLAQSFMIGDRWRDIAAGRNAGCQTLLIDCGYREKPAQTPDWIVGSLWEASRIIGQLAEVREARHAG